MNIPSKRQITNSAPNLLRHEKIVFRLPYSTIMYVQELRSSLSTLCWSSTLTLIKILMTSKVTFFTLKIFIPWISSLFLLIIIEKPLLFNYRKKLIMIKVATIIRDRNLQIFRVSMMQKNAQNTLFEKSNFCPKIQF